MVIDTKGRLLGKFSILDLVFFFIVLSFFSAFYFGFREMGNFKTPLVIKEFVEIEIPCKFINVNPRLLGKIVIGDEEISVDRFKIGKLIWKGEAVDSKYSINVGLANTFNIITSDLLQLPVLLRMRVEIRGEKMYYNNQLINVECKFLFKTTKYIAEVKPNFNEADPNVYLQCYMNKKFIK